MRQGCIPCRCRVRTLMTSTVELSCTGRMLKPSVIVLGFTNHHVEEDAVNSYPYSHDPRLDASTVVMLLDDFPEAHTDWYRRECTRFLADGGQLVLLCKGEPSPGLLTGFGRWLQSYGRFGLFQSGGAWTIKCLVSELRPILENDLAYNHLGPGEWEYLAFAHEDSNVRVAGRIRVDRGEVVALPYGLRRSGVEEALALIRAIPEREEYPLYLDDLVVGVEPALRTERDQLESRLIELESELNRARMLKRILYVGHTDLEALVVEFLKSELDIPARHVPGVGEDFWLTQGEIDWAIGEVKSSSNGNVDKDSIAQLWSHRKDRGKPEDFPALLVANTFYKRQALKDREEQIHPDVAKRAKEDHIVVIRTLDLFRMRGQPSSREAFLECLRTGGGWFRIHPDLTWELLPA
jgi:hypothetical protein